MSNAANKQSPTYHIPAYTKANGIENFKINDLFKDAGLKTFAQIAKATVPQMRTILDKGGSRYRIANPSTWAQQAALANSNKWAELKTLQDALSAGLKK